MQDYSKVKLLSVLSIYIIMLMMDTGCRDVSGVPEEKDNRINVRVQPVQTAGSGFEIKYSGTIEESETMAQSFPVLGAVSSVYVSEGDRVKKGQVLAELNSETYRNTYDMALAALKQAEDAYKRLQSMYGNGNLPEIKLVDVETKLQQAKSAAAIANKNLKDCKLYASIDGIVGKRSIEAGMSAVPNLAAINIVKIDKVYAKISVSENEIASIYKGDKAKVEIPAIATTYSAAVKEIGVIADPLAHTYKVKILMPNPELRIRPGMICNVSLLKKKTRTSLLVPSQAVIIDNSGKCFVYAVNRTGDRAERKYIKTGKLLNKGIEITEGLGTSDFIVVSGQHKLSNLSRIRIVGE